MVGAALPRQRILDAALALAAEGGLDALQVRAIATRASVSSRTIYEHFPSLESLLIVAVAELAGTPPYLHYTQIPTRSGTALARVRRLIDDLNEIMTTNWTLTVALLRALLCGKPDVAQHVRNFVALTEAILIATIAPNGATAADREAAQILERVWFSTLVSWATGVEDDDRIADVMRTAASRILA
jgi:AcrR family transcriptional regulator